MQPSHSQVPREPEPFAQTDELFGAFPHLVEVAALEMDSSTLKECVRQRGRVFHASRQRHRRLAQCQRPVGIAQIRVTDGRIPVGADATVVSNGVRQRPMLLRVV